MRSGVSGSRLSAVLPAAIRKLSPDAVENPYIQTSAALCGWS